MYYTENNNICLDIIKHVRQIAFLVRNLRESECCKLNASFSVVLKQLIDLHQYKHSSTLIHTPKMHSYTSEFQLQLFELQSVQRTCKRRSSEITQLRNVHMHIYINTYIDIHTYIYVRACIYKNTIWIKRFLMPRTRDVPLTYVHFYTSVGLIAFYF